MSDLTQRRALRRGLEGNVEDQARWLAESVRAGDIPMPCIWIACVIGDPAARRYTDWGLRTVNEHGTVLYSIPIDLSMHFGAHNAWEADRNIEELIGLLSVAGNIWRMATLPCTRCQQTGVTDHSLCLCRDEDGARQIRTIWAGPEAVIRGGLAAVNLVFPEWQRCWRQACNGGNGACSPPNDMCPPECQIIPKTVRAMKMWLENKTEENFILMRSELNVLGTIRDVDPLFRDLDRIADDVRTIERFMRGYPRPRRMETLIGLGRILDRSMGSKANQLLEDSFREAIRRELVPWLFAPRSA